MPQIKKEPTIKFKPTKKTIENIAELKQILQLKTMTATIETALEFAVQAHKKKVKKTEK